MKGALLQIESEKPEGNEKLPSETDRLAFFARGGRVWNIQSGKNF